MQRISTITCTVNPNDDPCIFGDAFYFIALLNKSDRAHSRAKEFLSPRIVRPIVTTAWALIEVADGLAQPRQRSGVLSLMRTLRGSSSVEIIEAEMTLFDRGFDLYSRRPDKASSLTDCISFVVMTEHGLTDALTGDRHSEQAGFRALLRDHIDP